MYYPKSQIKTNLYSNGGEFIIELTKTPYIGYYFETSKGEYFSGRTPDDRPNQQLIKISNLSEQSNTLPKQSLVSVLSLDNPSALDNVNYINVIQYNNALGKSLYDQPKVIIPYYNPQLPLPNDYQIGEFRRYFCKKSNEVRYLEIDQTQFDLLTAKDDQILWQLYDPFYLPWTITGDKESTFKTNRNLVTLTSVRQKLPKLGDYLKHDYLKYYR